MAVAEDIIAMIDTVEYIAAPDSDANWMSPAGNPSSRDTLTELVDEYAGPIEDDYRILEVGCGDGTLTEAVSARYEAADLIGVDLSHKYAFANLYGQENTIIMGGDAFQIMDELAAVDFLYAVNMLQATEDPGQALQTMYDQVVDGGFAAITVPTTDVLDAFPDEMQGYNEEHDLPQLSFSGIDIGSQTPSFSQYVFPEERMIELCTAAGFTVRETRQLQSDAGAVNALFERMGVNPSETEKNQVSTTALYMLQA